jgi:hypothetical protein
MINNLYIELETSS